MSESLGLPEALRRALENLQQGRVLDFIGLSGEAGIGPTHLRTLRTLARLRGAAARSAGRATGEETDHGMSEPGNFEILVPGIGSGGFSVVHKARDRRLGRLVALKTIKPGADVSQDARELFRREAGALAALKHEHVVQIHQLDVHDSDLRLVLEWIEGETLDQQMEAQGALSWQEAVQVGLALCSALAAIHGQGLIHGDIKPQNVMREHGGRIVLLDFGLVRFMRPVDGAEPPATAGTPTLLAPEQLTGDHPLGPGTDIYGLGVLLYWLVSKHLPFEGGGVGELCVRIAKGQAKPLLDWAPRVPRAFVEVVEHAMRVDPLQRYVSAGELESALRKLLTSAARAQPAARKWLAGGLVSAVAITLGVLAWREVGAGGSEPAISLRGPPAPLCVLERVLTDESGLESGEPLESASTIASKDRIWLRFRADEALHVYVFNEDAAGAHWALFPLAGHVLDNPVPAGVEVRLPGAVLGGIQDKWEADANGGEYERFLIVVGRKRVRHAEELHAKMRHANEHNEGMSGVDVDEVMRGFSTTEAAAHVSVRDATTRDRLKLMYEARGACFLDEAGEPALVRFHQFATRRP